MSKIKSNLQIVNNWGYFPKYRKSILDDGSELWPIERPIEFLRDRENQMGPVVFAQEMLNEPIPDHDLFGRDDFVACYDVNQLGMELGFETEITDPNYTYAGADIAVSLSNTADFMAI